MVNLKDVCLELAKSDTEEKVIDILKKQGYWDNPDAWAVFGGNLNNFATIGNQQSRPEAALVEKLINSVDAVLMSEALKRGTAPDGLDAPRSMAKALEEYFKIPDGKLSNISPRQRTELAQRIRLVATGSKRNPCYSIIDDGEGQTPNKFIDSFLSTGKTNKLSIPFVQGKFNMGGTGVFQFCGKNNIQLIISKRHPGIVDIGDDSQNEWGFTIIRREKPGKGVKSSVYKYLAPGGKIPSFKADSLLLLPGPGKENYTEKMEWGTYIKLYEYQMEGLKTNILLDLYNALSLLMPSVALPIRMQERRDYEANSYDATLAGLSVRLEEDKKQNLEEKFPTSSTLNVSGQNMKASIYVFKKEKEEKYKKNEGIIFTINGQTHGSIDRRFFSRSTVHMAYLEKSILVIVDCTEIEGGAREDLFMNSRDRLRSCELKTNIEANLVELIRDHPGLKELREERKRQAIQNKIKDDRPLVDVLEKLIKKSPTLSKLFVEGLRLPTPFKTEVTGAAQSFKGNTFPTFFNLVGEFSPQTPKRCPSNKKVRVRFHTDAVNDYFDRDNDPGIFEIYNEDESVPQYALNLWSGNASLTVALPEGARPGDIITLSWRVSDKTGEFADTFYVMVTDPVIEQTPGRAGHRRPTGSEKGTDADRSTRLNMPSVIDVYRPEWAEHGFDEESALKVIDGGDSGYDFYINMDNKYLLYEKKSEKEEYLSLLDNRYKYGMILLGLALLHHNEKNPKPDEENGEDISTRIQDTTKAISPFLLPMISQLGDLKPEESE